MAFDPAGIERFLDVLPDAVLGVSEQGTIVLANEQAAHLFGYPSADLVGRPVDDLVPDRHRGRHGGHRGEYLQDPRTRPMAGRTRLAGRRRDGSEFPAEISLSSTRSSRGVVAWAAVRDISDRLAAEEERERMRRAADDARALRLESLGELAGGVAHDFNNLLGVIMSYASLVRDDLDDRPDLAADVDQIRVAAQRGATLTRQMLLFGRRELPGRESLDLVEVVDTVRPLLQRAVGERITIHVAGAAAGPVLADRGQLEQVLLNLAVNARDAMPSGGALTLTVTAAGGPDDQATLTVADTGAGMTPDVLDRAMEPFFTTKAKGQGTGLGLATVYGIVTHHGGRVSIASRPGDGATVTVTLPAASDAPRPDAVGWDRSPIGRGERVVVVEDDDGLRASTVRTLERAGCLVQAYASASDALDRVLDVTRPIDLVLTDVVMPGVQGTELADRVADARPGTPVLLMSGYSDELAGIPAVGRRWPLIAKPFDACDLLRRIRRLLDEQPDPGEGDPAP
ncbi:MAG: ATP-binding protein [Solirubrobacteraceae bacterium]|nr:ATP-binding protein [Solirubrobacteraceae bacterium]